MRAVVQRVSRARVTAGDGITGEIADGLMILLGVGRDDTSDVANSMAEKIANLRIFEDDQRKMNRSLLDIKGRQKTRDTSTRELIISEVFADKNRVRQKRD